MKLSILSLSPEHKYRYIDHHVIEDSGLSRILDDRTWSFLKAICPTEEILARQKLFRALMEPLFKERFCVFHDTLNTFLRSDKLLTEAETVCEGLFLFTKHYRCFQKLIETIKAFPLTDSIFIERLSAYAELKQNEFREYESLFSEYQSLLDAISHSKIHVSSGSSHILKAKSTEHPSSVIDEIKDCKRTFGYSEDISIPQTIRMSLPISETLQLLYPNEFSRLLELKGVLHNVLDNDVFLLKEEADFYLSVFNLVEHAAEYEIPYSFATVSDRKQYIAKDIYDISLLAKHIPHGQYVPNQVFFTENEHCFFLLGANGGGKTTYLRAVASNLILFLSGCPIFCESAEIYPFDMVFTHFPADEHFDHGGRLFDEECRVRAMLDKGTENSFIFLNETFTGADARKGLLLSLSFMRNFAEKNAFCLFVTHFYEVMEFEFPVLCAAVNTDQENQRTFKIERGVREKRSYAEDILKKYRLDRNSLAERRKIND